jgi:hypothetical protein
MSKDRGPKQEGSNPHNNNNNNPQNQNALSRRNFLKQGAVAGGAAALSGSASKALARQSHADGITWDYEADVVVCGAGAMGLPAAIRAHDLGASVLVLDQNFDVGGRMSHSGGWVSLGGGDPIQKRDYNNEPDAEGFIKVDRQVPQAALDDNIELLFKDMTDWSLMTTDGYPYYRYNNPDQHRGWAENAPATRQFLMDNYVRFARINGTHLGGGTSRARASFTFLPLGEVTNVKRGSITAEDAGVADPERQSAFGPAQLALATSVVGPNAVYGGGLLNRCLEFSAREKGVRFMLNRYMTEIIRDKSGQVVGVRATYTPRFDPDTHQQLKSYWSNGNINETRDTITVKARRAVVVATSGHSQNPIFRSQFYPRMNEPWFPSSGFALLGPRGRDASGIIAGLRVGASLDGLQQNLGRRTWHVQTRLGTRDAYTSMYPGHPAFPFRKSAGFNIGHAGFEHVVAVNQVGQRLFNEMLLTDEMETPRWPGGPAQGVPETWDKFTPTDWRNCRASWLQQSYDFSNGVDAAVQMNEGSTGPDYYCGPLWAIFDQAAVDRAQFPVRPPYISTDNGCFFKADTLDELAAKIYAGNSFQRVRLKYLAETIKKWNGYVDNGSDPDFERGKSDAPMHKIDQPPYYAASIMVIWHDSYGGLRLDRHCQVLDMEGKPIPGLFSGGEASGGGQQHGLGRALVHGYIAGTNAVTQGVVGESHG